MGECVDSIFLGKVSICHVRGQFTRLTTEGGGLVVFGLTPNGLVGRRF